MLFLFQSTIRSSDIAPQNVLKLYIAGNAYYAFRRHLDMYFRVWYATLKGSKISKAPFTHVFQNQFQNGRPVKHRSCPSILECIPKAPFRLLKSVFQSVFQSMFQVICRGKIKADPQLWNMFFATI